MSRKTPIRAPAIRPGGSGARRLRVSRRGRVVRRILGTIVLIGLIVLVAGVALYFHTRSLVNSKGQACPSCAAETSAPLNILVLGSDSRAVLDTPQDLQHYDPTGQDRNSGQRADSIVLLHIDPKSAKAVALALPRDLKMPAPGGGFQKINAFYNQKGGVSDMVQAVHNFTGLPVNHYVEVNFNSFRTITNALGGVNVRFTRAVNDPDSGLNQPAGCNLLTGDQALAFVRVRHIDSDYGRIARQQLFVKIMMGKVLSAGTLLNPQKVVNLINLGAGNLGHDNGLGLSQMTSLAVKFRHFSTKDIDFRVVPSVPNPDGYVVANQAQSQALFTAMRNGTQLPDYGRQGVSALAPSDVSATILNGTTTNGLAAKAGNDLRAKGYGVLATKSADRTDYEATAVYYSAGNQDKAQFLATQMFPGVQVQPVPAALDGWSGDAIVVVGKDYPTIEAAALAKSGSSSNPLLPAGAPVQVETSVPWFSPC